jgi:hypothetical protein
MCAQQGPASTFVEEFSKKDRRFYRVCATAICAHAGTYISEGKSSERTNRAGVCAYACCCTSSAASLHHQYSGFLLQCRNTFLLLCAGSTVTAGESFDCFSNFASNTFHGLDFLLLVIMRLYEWCCSLHPTIHRH